MLDSPRTALPPRPAITGELVDSLLRYLEAKASGVFLHCLTVLSAIFESPHPRSLKFPTLSPVS